MFFLLANVSITIFLLGLVALSQTIRMTLGIEALYNDEGRPYTYTFRDAICAYIFGDAMYTFIFLQPPMDRMTK